MPENSDKPKITQDQIVDKLRPDPSKPAAKTVVLHGHLGKSDKAGWWRLYDTPRLDSYYEIREADIVATEQVAVPDVGSGTRVLVAPGEVQYVQAVNLEPQKKTAKQAQFLTGEYSTLLGNMLAERRAGPAPLAASGIVCDLFNTWGGGYTCDVYRQGQKLHDSINVVPCAYTLGFDPGCNKMPGEVKPKIITEQNFCTWSCSWHEWC